MQVMCVIRAWVSPLADSANVDIAKGTGGLLIEYEGRS